MQCNPEGFILSTKCLSRWLPSSLTAYCPKKGLTCMTYWLASTLLINRQVNRICTHFSVRKICLHMTFKTRRLHTINEFSLTSNELTAIFYVMPDWLHLSAGALHHSRLSALLSVLCQTFAGLRTTLTYISCLF